MTGALRQFELPLLGKELVEQAMRPRTYLLRVAYAGVLFTLFAFMLYARFAGGDADLRGVESQDAQVLVKLRGREIFRWIVAAQMAGVFLFLPAMMADAITRERERNALDLLLITELRPWDILAQKLLSRIVPMASILMLSMPLLGVAYSYGGVEGRQLWTSVWAVGLTCFQVGAICMLLAVDAPKTSTAMLSSYIRLPIVMIGLLIFGGLIGVVWRALTAAVFPELGRVGWSACVVPAGLAGADVAVWAAALYTMPAVGVTVWYLRRSVARLLQMSEARPGEQPQPTFELAFVPRRRRNRAHGELPDKSPIVWMDRTSHLMVQLRKVFFVAITIDLPIFLWLAANVAMDERGGQRPGLAVLTALTWIVGAPIVAMIAASAFAAERTGQTLDVLLATPITTPDLIRQKSAAARWFARMMCIPIGAAIVTEWVIETPRTSGLSTLYIVASGLCLLVYMPLAMWTGVWVGMIVRDRARAMLVVLAILGTMAGIVPALVSSAVEAFGGGAWVVGLLSPATIFWTNETGWPGFGVSGAWTWTAVNFALWGAVLWWVRRWCLHGADALLGRVPAPRGATAREAAA